MKKSVYTLVGFLWAMWLVSCKTDTTQKEIEQIPIALEIVRFDSLFVTTSADNFHSLKKQYPYLFPSNIADSIWLAKQKDTLELEITAEIQKQFKQFSSERKQLHNLFQHIKYYFPDFESPKIITLASEVDYRSRVIYADSLLLIGLDNYLGANHRFYEDIEKYIRSEFEKENIVIDVAETFSEQLIPRQQHLSFLDAMIFEGKKLYLMQLLLPKKSSSALLKYTKEQWNWVEANESEMWRYFVENELLYQTDKKLLSRFLYPAPFSKFYLELDNESPGQVGKYIGFNIVKSYADNHSETSLVALLSLSADELFKKSYYKPKK
ncbi:gliding motility lipoprotein GldB [Capnocytophaga canimorsus]|uniref:gliding motility lipoprotein GldB n=1 Tax=Capnocytophaga canimorsus TaxID=28188 RepID=UPI0037CE5BAC